MKIQGVVFLATAAFMAVIGLAYWFTSYEPTGTTILGMAVGLGLLPGVVLYRWSKRFGDPPADRSDADPDEAATVVGWFAASSAWPVVLAAGAALMAAGLVFGLWAGLPGLAVTVVAFVGGTLESRSPH